MEGIMYIITFLVKKLKKLTNIPIRPLGSRLHCYWDLRLENKIRIKYDTDSNERTTDISRETRAPKSIPMTESHTAPPNSPEITSNNPKFESTALHLYRNGTISLGKAGEILGLSKQEMLHLLSIRDTLINYDVDDLESDLETLDRVLG